MRLTRLSRSVLAGTLLALAVLIGPPAAVAGTASVEGSTLVFTASPGEANSISVTRGPLTVSIADALPIAIGAGCDHQRTSLGIAQLTAVTCRIAADRRLEIRAGDGDDSVRISDALLTSRLGRMAKSEKGKDEEKKTRVDAGPGNDEVDSGSGNDQVAGGSGDDELDAGAGDDEVSGGSGADATSGGTGDDEVSGEDGTDTVSGGDGDDTVEGDEGADTVSGDAGDDTVDGGEGQDTVEGGSGADTESGGAGDDTLDGGSGSDTVEGDTGDDELDGGTGDDTLAGDDGNDDLDGGAGNDTLDGGEGRDDIRSDPPSGPSGNDVIHSRDGVAETVRCGGGNDRVSADTVDVLPSGHGCERVQRAAPLPSEDGETPAGSDELDEGDAQEVTLTVITSPGRGLPALISKGLKLSVGCPEQCEVSAQLLLVPRAKGRSLRPLLLGRGKSSAESTESAGLVVKLRRPAKRLLARLRAVTLTLRTTVRYTDGETTRLSRRVTLRR